MIIFSICWVFLRGEIFDRKLLVEKRDYHEECVYTNLYLICEEFMKRKRFHWKFVCGEIWPLWGICLYVNLFVFQRLINVAQLLSNMHRRYLNVNLMSNFAKNNKTIKYKGICLQNIGQSLVDKLPWVCSMHLVSFCRPASH